MAGKGKFLLVSPLFCLMLILWVFMLPVQWLVAMALAAIVHEIFHLLGLLLVRGSVSQMGLFLGGARIQLPVLSRGRELFCAAAGPFGSFVLLLCMPLWPRFALCGLLQGLFNMIPVYPMDGGRILRCVLQLCFPPPVAEKILSIVEKFTLFGLTALSFYGMVALKTGIFPLFLPVILTVQKFSEKSLANRSV